jgi:hypothetical protein
MPRDAKKADRLRTAFFASRIGWDIYARDRAFFLMAVQMPRDTVPNKMIEDGSGTAERPPGPTKPVVVKGVLNPPVPFPAEAAR